jgi:hypothetical protein
MREPQFYTHGSKLKNKLQENPELRPVYEEYVKWKEGSLSVTQRNQEAVLSLVQLLNEYKSSAEPQLDQRQNSAQEVLQPSIIEEFFEYLFCNIEDELSEKLLRGPSSAFIDLVFNPRNLHSLATSPEYTLRRKDHDFVIGSTVTLTFSIEGVAGVTQDSVVVPAVAIECKRYLERNMLDECSGTAEKVKKATPYCLYFIVAEYLKMDDCRPELSKIDEIYILRRQRNSDRLAKNFIPNPIYGDLVWDVYSRVLAHLGRIWWDPNSALETGKLFNI